MEIFILSAAIVIYVETAIKSYTLHMYNLAYFNFTSVKLKENNQLEDVELNSSRRAILALHFHVF